MYIQKFMFNIRILRNNAPRFVIDLNLFILIRIKIRIKNGLSIYWWNEICLRNLLYDIHEIYYY